MALAIWPRSKKKHWTELCLLAGSNYVFSALFRDPAFPGHFCFLKKVGSPNRALQASTPLVGYDGPDRVDDGSKRCQASLGLGRKRPLQPPPLSTMPSSLAET